MKILCELKRFKEKVTRGRSTGEITEYNICVGGDNYSWNVNRKNLNANTPPIGQKYFKGFCHLLNCLKEFNIDSKEALDVIIPALQKNTGIDPKDLLEKIDKETDLNKIGEYIDEHFLCNYNRVIHDSGKLTDPNRIYVRVLKANIKTVSKEDE